MLYAQNSIVIALALFLLIIASNELGFRLGRFVQARTDTELKAQTAAIQASVIGLLALLLGFTFSMALQRFDDRSDAVVTESMAIGTALLRAELLPAEHRATAAALFKDYIDVRIAASDVALVDAVQREGLDSQALALHRALWAAAVAAAAAEPNPVTTGLYVAALNEMIDAHGARIAVLKKHVPLIVLLSLFAVFITTGAIIGYSNGLGGRRPLMVTLLLNALIVLVVFLIIDLDRPKRGFIQVDQSAIAELKAM